MRLFVSPEGLIKGVYDDNIPKTMLGTVQVDRASNVEFNEKLQRWEAVSPDGKLLCHDPSRNECLKKEKSIVEAMLLETVTNTP